jgi:hypothetical protein
MALRLTLEVDVRAWRRRVHDKTPLDILSIRSDQLSMSNGSVT